MKTIPQKIIFCHFSASGNKDAVEYLKAKCDKFAYLLLSFHHVSKGKTTFSTFNKSIQVNERNFMAFHPLEKQIFYLMPFLYLVHFFNVLRLFFFIKEPYDLFIGQNYFCSFCGIILKHLGKVKQSIYWAGDFFPVPPSGPYHFYLKFFFLLDKLCLAYSDQVWFMTPRLLEVRREKGLLPARRDNVYKIVPSPITRRNFGRGKNRFNFQSAVFLGVLSENQGVQETILAIPKIIKTIPSFIFTIIGSGYYENTLKKLTTKLNLEKHVIFKGFVSSEKEVQRIISSAGAAVAIYRPDKYSFTQFADSGKIKMYLSCGIPVIMTDVPYIAKELKDRKGGIVIDFNPDELANALIRILSDKENNLKYRINAINIAESYSPENIFREVFDFR